jgi:DNA-binding NtrC family response regulator
MLVRVIVAADDARVRDRVVSALDDGEVYVVAAVATHEADARLVESVYDVAFLDATVGDEPWRRRVERIRLLPDSPRVVALLDRDDSRRRARLLAAGAVSVIDVQLPDELLRTSVQGLVSQLRAERLGRVAQRRGRALDPEIVSVSAVFQRTLETARRVAVADSSVLLLGETGVGKERLASVIHAASPRATGPFVAVNCAAIPAELFESELFGHERGAFTGASRARRGQFELAHEGTLFLDEVGEVPSALQPKLLRALQEHRIRPIGSDKLVDIDVRVIAATNRDLPREMQAGTFRRDLYYRLSVVELTVPALRDRPEDVPAIASAFLERFAGQLARPITGFEPSAERALAAYPWPGNVRELINVVERAVLLCETRRVKLSDLPAAIAIAADPEAVLSFHATASPASGLGSGGGAHDALVHLPQEWSARPWKSVRERLMAAAERAYLHAVLVAVGGRVGDAARRAGISPRALFEKMRRHGLRKEDFRPARDGDPGDGAEAPSGADRPTRD